MKLLRFLVTVFAVNVAVVLCDRPQRIVPKMQYTRTALHVSRSLNPDSMQLLEVKTRSGDTTTLIVKKRDGKRHPIPSPPAEDPLQQTDSRKSNASSSEVNERPSKIKLEIKNRTKTDDGDKFIPLPVKRTPSQHREQLNREPSSNRRTGSVATGESGTKRHPPSALRVPAPVYVRSIPMYVKGEGGREIKRSRSLTKVGADGIPVIEGVRMPDDESDKQVWRNARVINGVLVPKEKSQNLEDRKAEPDASNMETVSLQHEDVIKETQVSLEQLVPHRLPVHDQSETRILNYIKTLNQRESERLGYQKPRESFMRFPSNRRSLDISEEDIEFTTQTAPDYYKSYEFPTQRSYKSHPTGDESQEDAQPRMLQYGSHMYPTSLLYTPQNKKPTRASFEEGVRTPVLQYAHPELGVQPAKQVQPKTGKATADSSDKMDAATFALFHQDLHSDRSPYVGMEEIDTGFTEKQSADYSTSQFERTSYQPNANKDKAPTKFLYDQHNYDYPRKNYYRNHDSYGLSNDDYIKRYPYDNYNSVSRFNTYSGPYLVKVVERPFWERITDSIRDQVNMGMEKVTDMTRPVVEPLIEASQKISKNLGFSHRGRGVAQIQEKIGTAVSSYPVLLPALGLMAGGAALGLGAVAVGRYLDVGVMKQRNNEDEDEDEMEHKRVLEGVDGGKWVQVDEGRSLTYEQISVPENGDGKSIEVDKYVENERTPASNSESMKSMSTDGERKKEQFEDEVTKIGDSKETDVKKENTTPESVPVTTSEQSVASTTPATKHRRKRETEADFFEDIFQSLELNSKPSGLEHLQHHSNWASTPCSKRLFCDVMIKQSEDAILLMEKKMATFLNIIQPNVAVSYHLNSVMTAVKQHNCSMFQCADNKSR